MSQEYVATQEGDNDVWKACFDGATRQQALAEAFRDDPAAKYYSTGEKVHFGWCTNDFAEIIIEGFWNQATDACGEAGEDEMEPTKEQEEDLNARLEPVLDEWIKKHSLEATCFGIHEIKHHTWQEAALAAMAEDLLSQEQANGQKVIAVRVQRQGCGAMVLEATEGGLKDALDYILCEIQETIKSVEAGFATIAVDTQDTVFTLQLQMWDRAKLEALPEFGGC